jgi:hypothetical protein
MTPLYWIVKPAASWLRQQEQKGLRMPHILLEGPTNLQRFFAEYQPHASKVASEILKLQNIFLSQAHDCLLIEALAVEGGPPNRFMIQVTGDDRGATVRIYPGTDPEKTPGVKRLLALVARQLKEQDPRICYGNTNLKEFLL